MNITEVTTRAGAHSRRKRVGRGIGSGLGKTSGRGHKGQGARAGGKPKGKLGEGGMFPLFRRIPKVGFSNKVFRTEYQVVNLSDLERCFESGGRVTSAALEEAGLVRSAKKPVKILGDGSLTKKLSVEAERFSASAATKIEASGGTVTRLGPQPKKKFVKRPPTPKPDAKAEAKAKRAGGEKGAKADQKAKKPPAGKPSKADPAADESSPPGGDAE